MRIFLTCYQKSGTHQIMPAIRIVNDIVGRGYVDMVDVVKKYDVPKNNKEGIEWTCARLSSFEKHAFGHLPYHADYAKALRKYPTKVLFNVRDPRDIVVANYHSIFKVCFPKDKPKYSCGLGHLNYRDRETGELVIEKPDPMSELIKIEAMRWKYWLGWLDEDFTMMVKYENLRTDPGETIAKIMEFCYPYKISFSTFLNRLTPARNNPTFRSGRVGDWRTEFNDEQKELSKELLGYAIERLGYDED